MDPVDLFVELVNTPERLSAEQFWALLPILRRLSRGQLNNLTDTLYSHQERLEKGGLGCGDDLTEDTRRAVSARVMGYSCTVSLMLSSDPCAMREIMLRSLPGASGLN